MNLDTVNKLYLSNNTEDVRLALRIITSLTDDELVKYIHTYGMHQAGNDGVWDGWRFITSTMVIFDGMRHNEVYRRILSDGSYFHITRYGGMWTCDGDKVRGLDEDWNVDGVVKAISSLP